MNSKLMYSWAENEPNGDSYEPDTRTFGKRPEAKLFYCDNCGKHHWGRMEKSGGWEFTEWDFRWTTPQGEEKDGFPCK